MFDELVPEYIKQNPKLSSLLHESIDIQNFEIIPKKIVSAKAIQWSSEHVIYQTILFINFMIIRKKV